MESNKAEQEREERIIKNENRFRDLNNTIKHNDINIIGIPEGEQREKGA